MVNRGSSMLRNINKTCTLIFRNTIDQSINQTFPILLCIYLYCFYCLLLLPFYIHVNLIFAHRWILINALWSSIRTTIMKYSSFLSINHLILLGIIVLRCYKKWTGYQLSQCSGSMSHWLNHWLLVEPYESNVYKNM